MALVRWARRGDFVDDVRNMQKEMDRLWQSLAQGQPRGSRSPWEQSIYPPVNLYTKEDTFVLECELPGFSKDDIDISISGDTLLLKGTRKEEDDSKVSYHRKERCECSFNRSLQLPDQVDAEKTTAVFTNGILRLELAKAEKTKPRKISVKTT